MVPRVLQTSSIEDKHVVLVEGIFNYFAVAYATKEKKRSCKKRQRKIASNLRKAKEMKNDTRHELAIAKRANSFSSEKIMSLARKLYQSVRVHNKVKKYWTNPKRELELKLPVTSAMKISGTSLRNFLKIEQLLMYNLCFLKMQLMHSSLPPIMLTQSATNNLPGCHHPQHQ